MLWRAAAAVTRPVSLATWMLSSRARCLHALPSLKFSVQEGLAPVFSARQLDFHYHKHHNTYVEKLNALIKDGVCSPASPVCCTRALSLSLCVCVCGFGISLLWGVLLNDTLLPPPVCLCVSCLWWLSCRLALCHCRQCIVVLWCRDVVMFLCVRVFGFSFSIYVYMCVCVCVCVQVSK